MDPFLLGSFVPTTNVWNVIKDLQDEELDKDEQQALQLSLHQNIGKIATALNTKDTGYYPTFEFNCGQLFFPSTATAAVAAYNVNPNEYRPVIRKVVEFGALPNTATKSVAHGIAFDINYTMTRLYAVATDPVSTFSYIPIPYASATNQVEMNVDGTNINITTVSDMSAYTICNVVLEYITT